MHRQHELGTYDVINDGTCCSLTDTAPASTVRFPIAECSRLPSRVRFLLRRFTLIHLLHLLTDPEVITLELVITLHRGDRFNTDDRLNIVIAGSTSTIVSSTSAVPLSFVCTKKRPSVDVAATAEVGAFAHRRFIRCRQLWFNTRRERWRWKERRYHWTSMHQHQPPFIALVHGAISLALVHPVLFNCLHAMDE